MSFTVVAILFLALSQAILSPLGSVLAPSAPLDLGFRQMYNLQFDEAHQTFQAYEQSHPDDAMGPTSRAAAYLFSDAKEGACFPAASRREMALLVVPIRAATAS